MTEILALAALWLGLALLATLLSIWLRIATALSEIVVGTGSACRSERIAKYNRLLEIERELGKAARFGR